MAKEHKKQIWLRSDQVDVVADCLEYALSRMDADWPITGSPIAKLGYKIATKRIREIVPLFRSNAKPSEAR